MVCNHEFSDIKTICCHHIKCNICGIIKKTNVCDFHKKCLNKYIGKDYFFNDEIANFYNNVPLNKQSIIEHDSIFKEFNFDPKKIGLKNVIEIGSGIGRLIPMFLKQGLDYSCVEFNSWACNYIENCFDVETHNVDFNKFENNKKYDLVVCIHILEHFYNSEEIFEKLVNLVDNGKYLFIEIPNDKDLYNPDHFSFFNKDVLIKWSKEYNLKLVGFTTKKLNDKEDYMYYLFRRSD